MRVLRIIAAAAILVSATAAQAGDGVGEAMAVIDAASASGETGDRTLEVGSDVYVGDLVATDAEGEAQLLFADGTRMIVGSNSSLVIDEFLFRANSSDNKFAVRALGGAFRFISGSSGDQGYSIRTPSATINPTGTAFDFTVVPGEGGGTKMVLLGGGAKMCEDDDGDGKEDEECATVVTPCGVLQTTDDEEEKVEEVAVEDGRKQTIIDNFPYQTSDSTLLEDFKVAGVDCVSGGLAPAALTQSQVPVEAIIVGGVVIIGGVVIGILAGGGKDSNNNTNNNN
jgi:hypothetical protein